MKKETQPSHENNDKHRRCVFRWHGKVCEKAQLATNRHLCQRKTEGGLEKVLANLWSRQKIAKKLYASRGQETIWEIPIYAPFSPVDAAERHSRGLFHRVVLRDATPSPGASLDEHNSFSEPARQPFACPNDLQ
jgi:hypothetical protein